MTNSTTIYDAAYLGDYDKVVQQLNENPTLLTTKDTNLRLVIHWASISGNLKLVTHLLELGSPVDPVDDTDMTPLILAASTGKCDVMKLLSAKGANINQKNDQGHSALQYACSKGHREIVEYLLENDADVNITDIRGATPLHRAASKGIVAIVQMLIDHNANIHQRDAYGNTPFHLACEEDHRDEAVLLLQCGASLETKNKDMLSPLDLCTKPLKNMLVELYKTLHK